MGRRITIPAPLDVWVAGALAREAGRIQVAVENGLSPARLDEARALMALAKTVYPRVKLTDRRELQPCLRVDFEDGAA
jgi:hypothetical protein